MCAQEPARRRKWFWIRTLLIGLFCLRPQLVPAATFVVNSIQDLTDEQPGDGICSAGGSVCTLRAAVQETNALPGIDLIQVPSLQPRFRLLISGTGEDEATAGDFDITDDLIIEGIGPGVATIDGNLLDRVFDIFRPAQVTLRNLVIQGGNVGAAGGGIRNGGTLLLDRVTVQGNTVSTGAGGGVANLPFASLTILNSTFYNNNAATDGQGGGLANLNDAVAVLESVTFLNNAANTGGALRNLGDLQVHNTIFGPSALGGNCSGRPIVSLGFNLDAGNSCLLDQPSDVNNADPRLSVPAFNGGLSLTAALQPSSPAIDRGDPIDCPPIDQRGFPRPADGDKDGVARCDIGAFEVNPPTPTPTITPTVTPTVLTPTPTPSATPLPASPTPSPSPTSEMASVTPTPSATQPAPQPTPTTTPSLTASATPTVEFSRLAVDTVAAFAGQDVAFAVRLASAARPVVAAQGLLRFDPVFAPVRARADGLPDCEGNPALQKSFLAQFDPSGCVGSLCNGVKAFVFSEQPEFVPIPVDAVLWTCTVHIAADAPLGAYALTLSDVVLVDENGEELSNVQASQGAVVVVATPTPTSTPAATATPTASATSSRTATGTHTPTPETPSPCPGDCDGSREVTIDELVLLVNIALENRSLSSCPAGDRNNDGTVTIDEIVAAVVVALEGCPLS
jgi:hypothetical protein